MSFSLFILGFLLLPDLLWWWWADRRLRGSRWGRGALALFMAPMVAHVLAILFVPDLARRSHLFLPTTWTSAVYLWHLLILPATAILLVVSWPARALVARRDDADPSRRRFLQGCVALTPPLVTGGLAVGVLGSLGDFRVRRMRVRVPDLPPELDGATIAHVSDVHYGKFTTPESVDRMVRAINGLRADLVLMTGDLIDLSLVDLDEAIAFVDRLDRRSGFYLCEGNHDLIDDGEEFRRRVRAAGLPLLRDEAAVARVRGVDVQVLGAPWSRGEGEREASLARVRELHDEGTFAILLAHHPHCFDGAGGIPLTLTGHTHGGQIMLNERLGAGPVIYRYWSGLYERGGRSVVVSNGIGNWFPLRTSAPAELGHLTLVRA